MTKFLDELNERVLVCDGAMGTMLYGKGVFLNRCFDELNLSSPELVKEIHADYFAAGADIIETNTFGANRQKLMMHGLSEKVRQINKQGALIAKESVGNDAYVAGAIGPLDIRIEPWGKTSIDEARAVFLEQAEALQDGGVDLFILETFSDVNEICAAISGVRDASDLPIVAQMTIQEDGNSLGGTSLEVFARQLDEWGADVIGLNCSAGPQAMLDALERLAKVTAKKLSVQPNAGKPKNVEGRNLYLSSPEYMASYARQYVRYGARIVGGCCGTTPDHTKAFQTAVHAEKPCDRNPIAVTSRTTRPDIETVPSSKKSGLASKLAEGTFVAIVEIQPPRGFEGEQSIGDAKKLCDAGFDALTIVDDSPAKGQMSAIALAVLLEKEVQVSTCVRYSCSDHNLMGMQADLLGAYALGLRNLLLVTGEPPRFGDYPDATAVFDVDSIGLTNMVNQLNQGVDVGGEDIGRPTGFLIGVMANPGAVDIDREMKRLDYKIEAGAEFLVTPPVFDTMLLERFVRKVEDYRKPVIAGLVPLANYKQAEFLVNEIPGSSIPKPTLERMLKESTPKAASAEGIKVAQETLRSIKGMVQGVQFCSPSNDYDRVTETLSALDRKGTES